MGRTSLPRHEVALIRRCLWPCFEVIYCQGIDMRNWSKDLPGFKYLADVIWPTPSVCVTPALI